MTAPTFENLNLPEPIMSALARMNFTTPTPIQLRTIPVALAGRDVLGSAQTGTGKTAAFCIPMLARLIADPEAMALVVTPTRELATQILDVVHKLTAGNRSIRTALLIGGDSMGKQFAQLRERPRVIVGTPGRINDHLRRDGRLLGKVRFVAIDEADRMLDMGFSAQLDEILKTLPEQRQTLMFSATFPDSIIRFSRNYLNNPERISVNPENTAAPKIRHEVVRTSSERKYTDLLAELTAREGSVIVFVKTQHGTDRLAKKLESDNHTATPIHGGLRQNQRDRAVKDFRAQRTRILVATDVASRGLDIPHIEHVINYDLPQVAEDYIHRIGRTARAGAEGNAVAFVMPSDTQMWNAINRVMDPGAKPERVEGPQEKRGGGHKRGGYKSGGFKSGGPKGGRDFKKRDDNRKLFAREDRPHQGNGKASVKFYSKDGNRDGANRSRSDNTWNNKENRARYNAADGRFEQPREGRGDGRQDNQRNHDDRPRQPAPKQHTQGDRNHRFDGKPAFQRDDRDNRGNDRSERNYGPKPAGSKPSGFKSDAPRPGLKKTKSGKPAPGKKPFKFKEHSRKAAPRPAQTA